MLLGDADIEHALIRKPGFHLIESVPLRDGGGDANDFGVATRLFNQALAKTRV